MRISTGLLIGVSLIVLIGVFIGFGYRWPWTGFGETLYSKPKGDLEVQPKKTLWDWLQLLGTLAIPVVLATAGFWFTSQQAQRQHKLERLRARSDHRLEMQRAQDTALQSYLNQMGTLILDRNLLEKERGTPVYTLAQARTATVITRLDADHNRNVMRFLSNSGLAGTSTTDESSSSIFTGIDLRGANLKGVYLGYFDLSGADLRDANLTNATLDHANLSRATLNDATLKSALLYNADLSGASLYGAELGDVLLNNANLSEVTLSSWAAKLNAIGGKQSTHRFLDKLDIKQVFGVRAREAADLSGADLSGTNLRGAYLIDADVTQEQLSDSLSLYKATMLGGQPYKAWLTDHSDFPDNDADGIPYKAEKMFKRDPNNPDTDGDGVPDGEDATNNDSAADSHASSHDGA